MKVLLINIPSENRVPSYFPLGLGYLAQVMRDKGHNVEVWDVFAHGLKNDEIITKIPSLEYDVVGLGAMSTQYKYIKWISKELKKVHDKPIILGGALPTFSSEIVLKNSDVDICIMGEGEETIADLLDNMNNLDKVKGIHYKDKEKMRKNIDRPYIQNLDSIPFPAWDLFPMEIYLNTPSNVEGYGRKSMNVISARGCPFNCRYCSKTFSKVRMRSIDNIIEEIKNLKEKYGVQVINFSEELVMISKDRVLELSKKIKPLKLIWTCQGRVNYAQDVEMMKIMKDAGCVEIGFGIESGSQKILDNMNKNATVEMNINAIINARKAGLRPVLQTMFGYPGETRETIKETIEMYKKAHAHPDGISITTPIPGSVLYNDVVDKKMIKDEEKYLENLQKTGQFTVNLTEFSDEELLKLKDEAEKEMHNNYYDYRMTHPTILMRDYMKKAIRLVRYIRVNGIRRSVSNIIQAMKNNPELIFQAE